MEDSTGGVNLEIVLEDDLSKKNLWKELLNDNNHFVFGLDILNQGGVGGSWGILPRGLATRTESTGTIEAGVRD